MTKRPEASIVAASALALILAACGDSGGLQQPDVSPDAVIGAAVGSLLPRAAPGPDGGVVVQYLLDPTIENNPDLPEDIRQEIGSWAYERSTAELPQGVRDAIVAALPGREVSFLATGPAPYPPNDPHCVSGGSGAFVRLALLPGLTAHADVYLVVALTFDLCASHFWSAARMLWRPGGLAGGEWIVGQVIGGAVTG